MTSQRETTVTPGTKPPDLQATFHTVLIEVSFVSLLSTTKSIDYRLPGLAGHRHLLHGVRTKAGFFSGYADPERLPPLLAVGDRDQTCRLCHLWPASWLVEIRRNERPHGYHQGQCDQRDIDLRGLLVWPVAAHGLSQVGHPD